jgi:predicted branched-subunit amino acid permease
VSSVRPLIPLVWGVSTSTGILVATLLGLYQPGWGVVLSFPAATLIISVGTLREREDVVLPMTLRGILGATLGFVGASVAVSLHALWGSAADPEVLASLKRLLAIRWGVMLSLVPLGIYSLFARRRTRHLEGGPGAT